MNGLERFIQAQTNVYEQALAEIRSGRKRSHWMWFIFPQIDGLGFSAMSRQFAIKDPSEARAYLAHPMLGARLVECCQAVLSIENKTAHEVFGSPDDLKLRSCATLFASVSPQNSAFHQLLDRFFEGKPDERTLELAAR